MRILPAAVAAALAHIAALHARRLAAIPSARQGGVADTASHVSLPPAAAFHRENLARHDEALCRLIWAPLPAAPDARSPLGGDIVLPAPRARIRQAPRRRRPLLH